MATSMKKKPKTITPTQVVEAIGAYTVWRMHSPLGMNVELKVQLEKIKKEISHIPIHDFNKLNAYVKKEIAKMMPEGHLYKILKGLIEEGAIPETQKTLLNRYTPKENAGEQPVLNSEKPTPRFGK